MDAERVPGTGVDGQCQHHRSASGYNYDKQEKEEEDFDVLHRRCPVRAGELVSKEASHR